MRTILWVVAGLFLAVMAWVPLNLAGPQDIPFGAAIFGIVGTFVGGIIVLVAVVHWVRQGSRQP